MSVTTILGKGVPKPALTYWAAKEAADYAVSNAAEIAKLARSKVGRAEAFQRIKGAPWNKRDGKADIGTAVHDVAEAMAFGDPVDLDAHDPDVARYLVGLIRFFNEWRPDIQAKEMTVWNRTYGYAGTLDLIADLHHPQLPMLTMADYKTSKGVYAEVALQLAAYANAEFALLNDGSEQEIPGPIRSAAVIHLQPAPIDREGKIGIGRYAVVPMSIDPSMFATFLYAREVAYFETDLSKTAVGDALPAPELEGAQHATA